LTPPNLDYNYSVEQNAFLLLACRMRATFLLTSTSLLQFLSQLGSTLGYSYFFICRLKLPVTRLLFHVSSENCILNVVV